METNRCYQARPTVSFRRSEFICHFCSDLKIAYANPACCHHFKKNPAELIGKHFLSLLLIRKDRNIIQRMLKTLTPRYPILTIENGEDSGNGPAAWMQWVCRGFFNDSDAVTEIQAIGRDITHQKEEEMVLYETKQQYQAVVEDQMELVCR
ncbi:MAG: PAS domain-containing protein, partial [Deltaproteobacteria bacterium]|nr:PAS domain-containing protein [Deltaproteobacteria bacterium]